MTHSRNCSLSKSCLGWPSDTAIASEGPAIAHSRVFATKPPGDIFGMPLGRIEEVAAEITQRVYRGLVDTPKTDHPVRKAALADGVIAELEVWRSDWHPTPNDPAAFLFPSESGTALSKDNVWRRNMLPKPGGGRSGRCNFQVMRRTHATLMRQLKADPKAVADQLGRSVDVSLNVYALSPVEFRRPLVNQLESLVIN